MRFGLQIPNFTTDQTPGLLFEGVVYIAQSTRHDVSRGKNCHHENILIRFVKVNGFNVFQCIEYSESNLADSV